MEGRQAFDLFHPWRISKREENSSFDSKFKGLNSMILVFVCGGVLSLLQMVPPYPRPPRLGVHGGGCRPGSVVCRTWH